MALTATLHHFSSLHHSTISPRTSIPKQFSISSPPPLNLAAAVSSSSRITPNLRPVAVRSPEPATAEAPLSTEMPDPIRLTYLEGNSWLWDMAGANILVDPVIVGNLDFGIPWLYNGAKKFLMNFRLEDLPELDCMLITQSLDDHCHLNTLRPLSEMLPDLRVIATPNAESKLKSLFRNVTYLEPGLNFEFEAKNGVKVSVFATEGPVLGPPWQRPENGYIISVGGSRMTLYYEPHCVFNNAFLENCQADIVITPVIKQLLPALTLVSGQEDAVALAKSLGAKYIIPMKNGDLDAKGILASILSIRGTVESFQELLAREVPDAQVLEPKPGVPLEIPSSAGGS